jgi:hypothetical protein
VFHLEGLPGVSNTLARSLLAHFDSVRADVKELRAVEGIGANKAAEIHALFNHSTLPARRSLGLSFVTRLAASARPVNWRGGVPGNSSAFPRATAKLRGSAEEA